MCGICGIAYKDPKRPAAPQTLRGMTDLLIHRGPDSGGYHISEGVGLGVRRLSIVDPEHGDQPLLNEDGGLAVVCNGEIYNYVELREELRGKGHRFRSGSDAEVIVHLYEEYGPQCVHRLRGMFAFALWDESLRQLLLARDRLGIKPLYYHHGSEGLIFGSEAKAVLHSGSPSPRLDPVAVRDLFTFGYVLGPHTFFREICRLPPGHTLTFRDGTLSVKRFWQVSFPRREVSAENMSAGDWAEGLLEKLRECVRIHLRSDVPLGTWLSGGIDSSAIAALMSEITGRAIPAFSLGFEEQKLDEVHGRTTLAEYGSYRLEGNRVTCSSKDFDNLPRIIWHGESVSAHCLEVPRWVLSQPSGDRVKAVLSGEGSDEVFGGYGWFRADRLLRQFSLLPVPVRRFMDILLRPLPRWKPNLGRQLLSYPGMDMERYCAIVGAPWNEDSERLLSPQLREEVSVIDPVPDEPPPSGFDLWHPFAQLQYFELTVRLPNYILHHLDHMSMAHSLETRVPFLDHELVEYCAAIPPSMKMRLLNEKYILRKAMRGILPDEILKRRKFGLSSPLGEFLAGRLPEFVTEMLSPGTLRRKGYFHPPAVDEMLRRHRRGERGHGARLMAVVVLQLWDEIFIRGAAPV